MDIGNQLPLTNGHMNQTPGNRRKKPWTTRVIPHRTGEETIALLTGDKVIPLRTGDISSPAPP